MSDDPSLAEIQAEHRRLVGAPDGLSTVMRGDDRLGTWELRDGPHPMSQDPGAVQHEFITHRLGRGGGISSGIGPRVTTTQIAVVGTVAHEDRHDTIGYLEARCVPSVATVRVHYEDGVVRELPTTLSSATGERWAVCPLDSPSIAIRVEFLDERGAVLATQPVQDPRTHHERE
jgi:hypothetical protein